MAKKQWEIHRKRDTDVITAFRKVAAALNTSAQLNVFIAEGSHSPTSLTLNSDDSNATIEALTAANDALAHRFQSKLGGYGTVSIVRPNDASIDRVSVDLPDDADPANAVKLFSALFAEFPGYAQAQMIERVLGAEVAQFYRARDSAVLRLEAVTQKLIEDTDAYRRKLDERADTKRSELDAEYQMHKSTLDAEVEQERVANNARAAELDERTKALDDRDSKHARRALRQDLQRVLSAHAEKFTLTKGTSGKRRAVHAIFFALLAAAITFSGVTVVEGWGKEHDLVYVIRLAFGFVGLAAVFVFYIRWTDQWFRQHADEEFRLKRMSLDVDRASWVVETAMEWQHQNKAAIPGQLLEQLSRDLFATATRPAVVRHPTEDILGAALSTASSLKVKLPGGSEASFDRGAVKKLNEALEADGHS